MAKKKMTSDTEATVRLSRFRGAKGPITPRVLRETEQPVTLEEMLTAFQKSLGRANRSSLEASRGESEFLLGIRALYVIDGLNVTLRVGVRAASFEGSKDKRVIVDFDAPENERSEVQFRVQSKPLEATKANELLLADGDPLGNDRPRFQLIATLIGVPPADSRPKSKPDTPSPSLQPLKDQDVHFKIVGGDSGTMDVVTLRTNELGQAKLTVDAAQNKVESSGYRGNLKNVDLIHENDDFFVFVTSDDPSLASTVLLFNIDRSREVKPSKKMKRR
jgi:hypothetical protein